MHYRILNYYLHEVMKLRPLKKSISITLDADIIEKTRLLAEESDRSLSQYINILLKKHIEAKENRQKSTGDE